MLYYNMYNSIVTYEIYPTNEQIELINNTISWCHIVYEWVKKTKAEDKINKTPIKKRWMMWLGKRITKFLKQNKELKNISSAILRSVIMKHNFYKDNNNAFSVASNVPINFIYSYVLLPKIWPVLFDVTVENNYKDFSNTYIVRQENWKYYMDITYRVVMDCDREYYIQKALKAKENSNKI